MLIPDKVSFQIIKRKVPTSYCKIKVKIKEFAYSSNLIKKGKLSAHLNSKILTSVNKDLVMELILQAIIKVLLIIIQIEAMALLKENLFRD